MRVYPRNRYVSGTYKRECDICGWDYLRIELQKNWRGEIVCKRCYDQKPEREQLKPLPTYPPFKRD